GSPVCKAGNYASKHAPWTSFGNADSLNERAYPDLAADIANGTLPNLAFVVPNQCDDMHSCSIATGDAWLATNVPAMLGAVGPKGMLVLTWDEDDDSDNNHILTVFAGAPVKP